MLLPNSFDAAHLRALHRCLFQDVYEWAGEYRTVELAKWSRFAAVDQVERCVNTAAATIADISWPALDDNAFCDRAAAVYAVDQFRPPLP